MMPIMDEIIGDDVLNHHKLQFLSIFKANFKWSTMNSYLGVLSISKPTFFIIGRYLNEIICFLQELPG